MCRAALAGLDFLSGTRDAQLRPRYGQRCRPDVGVVLEVVVLALASVLGANRQIPIAACAVDGSV